MKDSTSGTDQAPDAKDDCGHEGGGSSVSETVVVEKAVSSMEGTMQTEEKPVDKVSDAVEANLLEDEASSNCDAEVLRRFGDGCIGKASSGLVRWLVVPLVLSLVLFWLIGNGKSGLRNSGVDVSSFPSLRRLEEMEASIEMSIRELRNDVQAVRRATESMLEEVAGSNSRTRRAAVEEESVRDGLQRLELEIVAAGQSLRALEVQSGHSALEKDLPAQISKDEVQDLTRKIAQEEVEKHGADGLSITDYALASGGATVLRHSEPRYPTAGANNFTVHPDATKMLQPSFGEPGQCFPLNGQSGFIEILLTAEIIPEAVTLEHVDGRVAYERLSAPKDCKVSAWHSGNNTGSHTLANFTYELEGKSQQGFPVNGGSSLQSSGELVVNAVRFEFLSNYGANHTCIYRFRVHGRIPEPALEPSTSTSSVTVNRAAVAMSHIVVAIAVSMASGILG